MANVTSDWDPLSEANLADPFAVQKEMRGKCRLPGPSSSAARGRSSNTPTSNRLPAIRKPSVQQRCSSFRTGPGGVFPWLPVQSDPPPQHADYRALVAPFFRMEKTKLSPAATI